MQKEHGKLLNQLMHKHSCIDPQVLQQMQEMYLHM